MAACAFCNTTLLFGGQTVNGQRYCNAECAGRGMLIGVAAEIPAEVVAEHVNGVHRGACPVCGGPGPVDVHNSYRVWSAAIVTSWSTRPTVSCRGCGQKRRLGDLAFSLFLGWWGFPWGLVMTPVQIARNIGGLLAAGNSDRPSSALERMIKLHLASIVLSREQAARQAAGTQVASR